MFGGPSPAETPAAPQPDVCARPEVPRWWIAHLALVRRSDVGLPTPNAGFGLAGRALLLGRRAAASAARPTILVLLSCAGRRARCRLLCSVGSAEGPDCQSVAAVLRIVARASGTSRQVTAAWSRVEVEFVVVLRGPIRARASRAGRRVDGLPAPGRPAGGAGFRRRGRLRHRARRARCAGSARDLRAARAGLRSRGRR